MMKTLGVTGAAALLAACSVPKSRPEPAPGGSAEGPTQNAVSGPGMYRIDPAQSEVRLLVGRAGAMARLGHNHVIVDRNVAGWVKFSGDPAAASFSLTLPVADFIVDDAQARREEGAAFSEDVPEDAKAGTRHNMLSAALLDADHFPAITLTSIGVTPSPMTATLTVDIAGHRSTLVVPIAVETSEGRIAASGTTAVRQSALGLTPFSVMLGALQVQDEFTVKFRFVAVGG